MTYMVEAKGLRKQFGDFTAVDGVTFNINAGLLIALTVLDLDLLWLPYGWLVLLTLGYGLFAYMTTAGFIYPNLSWEDPRRMSNRKAAIPSLIGSLRYSGPGLAVAWIVYMVANAYANWAIPTVILGLALMAGGTWFFVSWNSRRAEKAWREIGG